MHAGFGGGKIFDVLREKMIKNVSIETYSGWMDRQLGLLQEQ